MPSANTKGVSPASPPGPAPAAGRTAARPAAASVVGRLAPSPTGRLHLGNAFAFLLAWLSARAAGGRVILRLEDIDPERSRPEFASGIIEDLRWLGLDWDEGPDLPGGPHAPYAQSGRLPRYAEALDELARRGLAYECFCTRKELKSLAGAPHAGDGSAAYPGTCRDLSPARRAELLRQGRRACLRLLTGEEREPFTDLLLGPQDMSLAQCGGDFALRRSDGVFAYQLAVALDDLDMGVTQVLRGEDILSSTPRQLRLCRLMGGQPPQYGHLPLVFDHEGERLAKRHASLSLAGLRAAGATPAGVAGYLAWLAGLSDECAPAPARDLAPRFELARIRRGPRLLPPDAAERIVRMGRPALAG